MRKMANIKVKKQGVPANTNPSLTYIIVKQKQALHAKNN